MRAATTILMLSGSRERRSGGRPFLNPKEKKHYEIGLFPEQPKMGFGDNQSHSTSQKRHMLKTGSTGTDVSRLQKQLTAKGFSAKGADGDFGKNTKAAVVAFQKANGLKADGVVGKDTSKKLFGSTSTKYFDGKDDFSTAPAGGSSGKPAVGRNADSFVRNIKQVDKEMSGTGRCAAAVSKAIERTYGVKVWGNGNQIDNNLPRSKFRQVDMSLSEALKVKGAVLTWEKTNTRLGSKYGHTAITTGDGKTSISDYTEADTKAASARMGRQGLKVFIPT